MKIPQTKGSYRCYLPVHGPLQGKGYAEGGEVGDDYNTKLTPEEDKGYPAWKAKNAPKDSGYDYDLRGAYLDGQSRADGPDGHMDDKFKKPNHPTFSTFSKYAPNAPDKAGTWSGDTYVPNPKRGK